ncbi:CTP synthase [Nematocida sp. AWRm80]|nr:CTP synthase [Nematocida sp. AWRm80]
MKYILVCGGVISGVGKGVVSSSIGRILKEDGHSVTIVKIDPYLNYDAGTLGPRDHGEVFVLSDGTETDLDLGNYERFLGVDLSRINSITSGRMYHEIIQKERRGDYLGKTVQIVPHMTDHIKQSIRAASLMPIDQESQQPSICIIELGGVIGDIESITFIEALRQLILEEGRTNFLVVGVEYSLEINEEHKTKPIQASSKKARELGIPYDVIMCRSINKVSQESLDKIYLFTGAETIVALPNGNVLNVPDQLRDSGFLAYIQQRLSLPQTRPTEIKGKYFTSILSQKTNKTKVAIVGKYSNHEDAYLSIKESLKFAGSLQEIDCQVDITYFDTSSFTDNNFLKLLEYNGIIIPGGFGKRGVEQMIAVAQFARENNIPCLGICLGMQVIAIEYARNVLKIKNATSEELLNEDDVHTLIDDKINLEEVPQDKTGYSLIISKNPGEIRIGKQESYLVQGTKLSKIYKTATTAQNTLHERYRHRYGINTEFVNLLEQHGLKVAAKNNQYIDALELQTHPFYLGVQFHPEFLSKPLCPRPVFVSFIAACQQSTKQAK